MQLESPTRRSVHARTTSSRRIVTGSFFRECIRPLLRAISTAAPTRHHQIVLRDNATRVTTCLPRGSIPRWKVPVLRCDVKVADRHDDNSRFGMKLFVLATWPAYEVSAGSYICRPYAIVSGDRRDELRAAIVALVSARQRSRRPHCWSFSPQRQQIARPSNVARP